MWVRNLLGQILLSHLHSHRKPHPVIEKLVKAKVPRAEEWCSCSTARPTPALWSPGAKLPSGGMARTWEKTSEAFSRLPRTGNISEICFIFPNLHQDGDGAPVKQIWLPASLQEGLQNTSPAGNSSTNHGQRDWSSNGVNWGVSRTHLTEALDLPGPFISFYREICT